MGWAEQFDPSYVELTSVDPFEQPPFSLEFVHLGHRGHVTNKQPDSEGGQAFQVVRLEAESDQPPRPWIVCEGTAVEAVIAAIELMQEQEQE